MSLEQIEALFIIIFVKGDIKSKINQSCKMDLSKPSVKRDAGHQA